jgi:hypothetical protein
MLRLAALWNVSDLVESAQEEDQRPLRVLSVRNS